MKHEWCTRVKGRLCESFKTTPTPNLNFLYSKPTNKQDYRVEIVTFYIYGSCLLLQNYECIHMYRNIARTILNCSS